MTRPLSAGVRSYRLVQPLRAMAGSDAHVESRFRESTDVKGNPGNDYWVWGAVECVTPVIGIIEYNGVFGPDRAITVPDYFLVDVFAGDEDLLCTERVAPELRV